MLDLDHLQQYHENNRIEAKKALGGLPKSIWETYSAFANTLGGIIILGVIENSDKSFSAIDLPDPQSLIKEFWQLINNPHKVSANILEDKDVYIQKINGAHIVVIEIPRAPSKDLPVYIENDPIRGTYIREGESDIHCTLDQFLALAHENEAGLDNDLLALVDIITLLTYQPIATTKELAIATDLSNYRLKKLLKKLLAKKIITSCGQGKYKLAT